MKKFIGRLKSGSSAVLFSGSNPNLSRIESGFARPSIEKEKKFQMDYTLDEDEWFFLQLTGDNKQEMVGPYFSAFHSTADTNPLANDQYKELESLYLITGSSNGIQNILFNRVHKRFCIASKTFLSFAMNEPEVKEETNVVEFTGIVDAYWDEGSSKLYFKNYLTIKPLFKGIEKYYRSATEAEVNNFLDSPFFSVETTFKRDKVGGRSLKHIAEILDANAIDFKNVKIRKAYTDYARDYSELGIKILPNGKIKLSNPSDLTNVISLLQERLYISQITHEKRVATSTSKVS